MKLSQLIIFVTLVLLNSQLFAEDFDAIGFIRFDETPLHLEQKDSFYVNDDWIRVKSTNKQTNFSITASQYNTFGEQIAMAWNLTDYLSINLSVYDNIVRYKINNQPRVAFKSAQIYNKLQSTAPSLNIDRNLSGYKFGLKSELGLGKSYKLNINFDYSQLANVKLSGLDNKQIDTTSFALGIRKSRFGASVNTDIFLAENQGLLENSRVGFELDWHFNDDTKLSFGSKQSIKDDSNNLDSITGSVQYIKFQHNL